MNTSRISKTREIQVIILNIVILYLEDENERIIKKKPSIGKK